MPPSDAECAVLSILVNTLGDSPLSEGDADTRLLSIDKEDISNAFDNLRNKVFIDNYGDDGILLDPIRFGHWSVYLYSCDGWNQRRLRERLPHQWEARFFGSEIN